MPHPPGSLPPGRVSGDFNIASKEYTMLRTTGTLNVKRISQSRNGPFCVADLITEFGEFKVKDPLLDQFDEGQYRGTVWISQIYLSQYIDSYGRAVTELRARLDDIQIDTEADLPAQPDATIDIDPVEEAPFKAQKRSSANASLAAKPGPGQDVPQKRKPTQSRQPNQAVVGEIDLDLFGEEIYELLIHRKQVKLDPTIGDRIRFRAQTTRMHELNYEFTAKVQTWFPM
jgi:hypothetical protein